MGATKAALKFWIYASLDRNGYDEWHSHNDVWQLDLAETGSAAMSFSNGAESIVLQPGEAVAIPPGVRHAYLYDGPYGNWSMKFQLDASSEAAKPMKLLHEGMDGVILTALAAVFNEGCDKAGINGKCFVCPEQFHAAPVIESMLAFIMKQAFAARDEEASPFFLDRLRELLRERHGGRLRVDEAAASLGYSSSHFNALVKAQSGLSAKAAIDRERGAIAKELLLYSDMSAKELSDYMGFPDVFCFNKFFRREQGIPPGRFKRDAENLS